MVSSASSQEIRCHLPSPLSPTLFNGYCRRSGWVRISGTDRRDFFSGHSSLGKPLSISGAMSTTLPSSTPTLMLQCPQHRWQKVKYSWRGFIPGASDVALITPPGVKASWKGWNSASPDKPSVVSIFLPSASTASIRQEVTVLPFIITAQVPHFPTLQPSLVPPNFSSERRTSINVCQGSTANS